MLKLFTLFLSMLLLISTVEAQTDRTINGKVYSNDSIPIAYVTVAHKDLTVQTDAFGAFSIKVSSSDATLTFSSVGYKKVTIADAGSDIEIYMTPELSTLEDVIMVGYAEQKKANLTGAVSTINSEEIVKRPVMRASSALQGLAAGVTVTQSTGKPGADGGVIRIRGIGTLGDASPLVLIDGVNGTLDGVDPNDIESVSVLKDAASASIYGSRAANGVVLVTTKKGKGGKIKLTYEGYTGKQQFTDLPDMVDGYTFMTKYNEARANVGTSALYSDDYLAAYQAGKVTDPDHYPDTDWQKILYTGSGNVQRHYVSVAGGDKIKLMGSFSYQKQDGLIPGFSSESYAFRLNTLTQISKILKLETFMHGRHSPITSAVVGDDAVGAANRVPAIYPARLSDGRWGIGKDGYNTLAFLTDGGEFGEIYNSFQLTGKVTLSPFKDFDVELGYTPSISDYSQKNFTKSVRTYLPGETEPAFITPSINNLRQKESQSWEKTTTLLARYKYTWKDHNFSFLGGIEQIAYDQRQMGAYRENFDFPDLTELNSGSVINWSNSGTSTAWSLRSYFGRVNYNYKSKYLLEANFRADGSSRFAVGNRYGYFPSVSVGWVINKESFFDDINWVSLLKIRGSWGRLGNQNIGDNFPFASYLSLTGKYIFNDVPVSTAVLTDLANSNISWETSESRNLGLDFELFDKFSGSFDIYNRRTSGILLKLEIPAVVGLNAPYQNAGVVENKGWDLNFNYHNAVNGFSYSIGGNISNVKNAVVDLKGTGPYINGYNLIQEGYPINSLYGYRSAGLYQTEQEVAAGPVQFGSVKPGDIRYVDITGDTIVNADDRMVIGNPIPRLTYGLMLSASYKNIDLSVFLQGVGKRDVILTNEAAWALYNNNNIQQWQLDYWTPENTDAKNPRIISASTHNNFQNTDFWVYNAGYLRIKTLQLGYTFPEKLFQKAGISKLRVYGTADNLLTFDKMPPGWDPERPNGDSGPYPIARTYILGVTLSF